MPPEEWSEEHLDHPDPFGRVASRLDEILGAIGSRCVFVVLAAPPLAIGAVVAVLALRLVDPVLQQLLLAVLAAGGLGFGAAGMLAASRMAAATVARDPGADEDQTRRMLHRVTLGIACFGALAAGALAVSLG